MKPLIAVTGKGGTGKSTLSALLVSQLAAMGVRPVLAVDADPNACLGELLGLEVPGTMAQLRDATRRGEGSPGMSKVMQVDLGLHEILAEGEGFDLLTMGLPEGPGCYCYVNALLRDWLKKTSRNYAAIVIDNEAGMEHISRLVAASIDTLLVVAEPTLPAARSVKRILRLSRDLPVEVERRIIVWNKLADDGVSDRLREAAGEDAADAVVGFAAHEQLAAAYSQGERLEPAELDLPELAELAKLCLPETVSSTLSSQ